MKLIVAKNAGFCMGVRRAVELALDAPHKYEGPICTFGPLIHNPQVLALLSEKGIMVLEEIPETGEGTVLIRAHGVPPQTKQRLKQVGFKVIDATCPRVIRVHTILRKHAQKGYVPIIIGDADHPEVVGLLGYAGQTGHVVRDLEELKTLPTFKNAIIVAQTTQNTAAYQAIREWIAATHPHYLIFDTICDSTEKRQNEVTQLAREVDAIIVVGGRNSGNTQRLAEIASHSGKPAWHIESESELDYQMIQGARTIGITAGASTPNWTIKRVLRLLSSNTLGKDNGWRQVINRVQRILILTNAYLALGAGCLCYAFSHLQGVQDFWPHALIAMLYVQSMHILNHLTGRRAAHYKDPDRAGFYQQHKIALIIWALACGATGLVLAFVRGNLAFMILLAMSILGLAYNLRLIPAGLIKSKIARIRDIPGSKTILIALAWGVVCSLLPVVCTPLISNGSTWLLFVVVSALVLARTAFFDLLDIQGDRVVGRETIPILLGEAVSMRLLKGLIIGVVVTLMVLSISGWVTPLGGFLTASPLFFYVVLVYFEKRKLIPGIGLEFLVESQFILFGLLTLIYRWANSQPAI